MFSSVKEKKQFAEADGGKGEGISLMVFDLLGDGKEGDEAAWVDSSPDGLIYSSCAVIQHAKKIVLSAGKLQREQLVHNKLKEAYALETKKVADLWEKHSEHEKLIGELKEEGLSDKRLIGELKEEGLSDKRLIGELKEEGLSDKRLIEELREEITSEKKVGEEMRWEICFLQKGFDEVSSNTESQKKELSRLQDMIKETKQFLENVDGEDECGEVWTNKMTALMIVNHEIRLSEKKATAAEVSAYERIDVLIDEVHEWKQRAVKLGKENDVLKGVIDEVHEWKQEAVKLGKENDVLKGVTASLRAEVAAGEKSDYNLKLKREALEAEIELERFEQKMGEAADWLDRISDGHYDVRVAKVYGDLEKYVFRKASLIENEGIKKLQSTLAGRDQATCVDILNEAVQMLTEAMGKYKALHVIREEAMKALTDNFEKQLEVNGDVLKKILCVDSHTKGVYKKNDRLVIKMGQLEAKNGELHKCWKECERKLLPLQAKMDNQTLSNKAAVERLNATIENLKDTIKEEKKKNTHLKRDFGTIKGKVRNLSKEKAQLTTERELLREKPTHVHDEILKETQMMVEMREKEVKDLTELLKNERFARDTCTQLESRLKVETEKAREANMREDIQKSLRDETQKKVEELIAENGLVVEMKTEINGLYEKNRAMGTEIESFTSQVSAFEDKREEDARRIETLERDLAASKKNEEQANEIMAEYMYSSR